MFKVKFNPKVVLRSLNLKQFAKSPLKISKNGELCRRFSRCSIIQSVYNSPDNFDVRHIGPRDHDQNKMLEILGYKVINCIISILLILLGLIFTGFRFIDRCYCTRKYKTEASSGS